MAHKPETVLHTCSPSSCEAPQCRALPILALRLCALVTLIFLCFEFVVTENALGLELLV